MFLLWDVLCLLVLGVVITGGWQGKEGRQKGPVVLPCPQHGWPFADPAVRIQPPSVAVGPQNPLLDVWGEQARSSHSPAANKCLYLQHLQAWSLLHIMEKIPLFAMS